MKGRIVSLAVVVLLALSIGTALAAGPTGAIFTTTPTGGIVNENVRYNAKIEVYLDGGPGNHAPQTAAGLDDGWYVFQVTDPSGWVLLSMDPSKCRVIEVKDGIIKRLVKPSELGLSDGYSDQSGKPVPSCHILDNPDGLAGPSGRHDTNIDVDHGANGAIVVQLMPFLDTPNPGGVYKAWVSKYDTYKARGGDLINVPGDKANEIVKKKGVFQGYVNDPGFGPPRSDQKTDNFKVKEVPPYLKVIKYVDVNGNGIFDAGDTEYIGWKITIYETLYDGSVITTTCYTPCSKAVEPGATVQVEEEVPSGWIFMYVYVDGVKNPIQNKKIDVTFLPGDMMQTVTFGNFELVDVKACKVEDKDGSLLTTNDQTPIEGWWVFLSVDGVRQLPGKQTGKDGCATWTNLGPGHSYDVEEDDPAPEWTALTPLKYDFGKATSGASYSFTFVNFKNVDVKACKVKDIDGMLVTVDDLYPVEGWTVELTKNDVVIDTQKTGADGCYTWTNLGPVPGGWYDVHEAMVDGWIALTAKEVKFMPIVSGGSYEFTFINSPMKGCTPGFWQGGNDFQTAGGKWYWNTKPDPNWAGFYSQPYYWLDDFCTFFGCAPGAYSNTMWHFINPDSWEVNNDFHKAARSMTAAYLNASWGMAYAFTQAELKSMWSAYYSDDNLYELHTLLDKANNAIGGCPISASIPPLP